MVEAINRNLKVRGSDKVGVEIVEIGGLLGTLTCTLDYQWELDTWFV